MSLEIMDPANLQFFENFSYLGIFLAIALSGHLIPMPEEVILLTVGYIASSGTIALPIAIPVCVMGIVLADIGFYYLSTQGARFTERYKSRIKADILDWYVSNMKENTFLVMFLSRFVPALRIVSPLVAGAVRIRRPKFVFFSLISAGIYVPIITLIGYIFHSKITPLVGVAEVTRQALFAGFLIVVVIAAALVVKRKLFA